MGGRATRQSTILGVALLVAVPLHGCTRAERETDPAKARTAEGPPAGQATPPPAEPGAVPAGGPPAGFEPVGAATITEPWLDPREAWRDLASRLSLLRADVRRSGSPLLVTFEAAAVHVTGRDGRRESLRLPAGLRLGGVPVHLLMGADLAMRAWGPDGTEILLGEEVTVVRGVVSGAGTDVEEFRLLVKGGRSFRSIP